MSLLWASATVRAKDKTWKFYREVLFSRQPTGCLSICTSKKSKTKVPKLRIDCSWLQEESFHKPSVVWCWRLPENSSGHESEPCAQDESGIPCGWLSQMAAPLAGLEALDRLKEKCWSGCEPFSGEVGMGFSQNTSCNCVGAWMYALRWMEVPWWWETLRSFMDLQAFSIIKLLLPAVFWNALPETAHTEIRNREAGWQIHPQMSTD